MPQTIQRPPLGMLSLLDSKAGGIAPNVLLDEVRAVIDLEPLYGIGARGYAATQILAATITGVGIFAVPLGSEVLPPPGVARHLRFLSARTTQDTNSNFTFSVGFLTGASTSAYVQLGERSRTIGANERGNAGGACDFWQTSRDTPAIFVETLTASANVIIATVFDAVSL